jgi:tetratricopeptide (TPR) repeat protein
VPSEPAAPSGGSDPEAQIRRWAAQEWVTKGREQAENPEQELSFYRKALEVDPHFAPAFYYMGLLYWGSGNRDACLGAFRSFWEEATPEEKESLLLPVDVTLTDLALPEAAANER